MINNSIRAQIMLLFLSIAIPTPAWSNGLCRSKLRTVAFGARYVWLKSFPLYVTMKALRRYETIFDQGRSDKDPRVRLLASKNLDMTFNIILNRGGLPRTRYLLTWLRYRIVDLSQCNSKTHPNLRAAVVKQVNQGLNLITSLLESYFLMEDSYLRTRLFHESLKIAGVIRPMPGEPELLDLFAGLARFPEIDFDKVDEILGQTRTILAEVIENGMPSDISVEDIGGGCERVNRVIRSHSQIVSEARSEQIRQARIRDVLERAGSVNQLLATLSGIDIRRRIQALRLAAYVHNADDLLLLSEPAIQLAHECLFSEWKNELRVVFPQFVLALRNSATKAANPKAVEILCEAIRTSFELCGLNSWLNYLIENERTIKVLAPIKAIPKPLQELLGMYQIGKTELLVVAAHSG